ncbi:hypothetical protein MycrhDRAFT_5656 [Mycolicibacterium rhodesiae JS60]|nr:hypothetical protein MycrhDRAFT_5656 [Mycolicibacterium rhodesiae JS60]
MCLASSDLGGPRRCSADTRTAYQKAADQVTHLEHACDELSTGITSLDAHHYAAAMALPPDQRDAALANLTPHQIDALTQLRRTAIRPDVDAAFADTASLELTTATRDTSSKTYGDILVHRAHGTDPVHAQLIDPDIAVWRQPSRSDYAIAYRDGDAYRTIVTASKYKTAITMIDRIPILTPLDQSPGGIDDLQQQAHRAKAGTALKLATQAAYGRLPNPEAQQAFLAEHLTHARDEIVDAAAAPLHDEILDATTRHRENQRHAAAHAAATTARHDALSAGQDPDTAYRTAYHQALGTPTRGGAHIPHFDHHRLPADGIDTATHELLQHSGIHAYGPTTKDDYTVIARHGNDLKAWGHHDVYGTLRTPSIKQLGAQQAAFLSRTLSNEERAALRTYTSGRHLGDGAYIAINDAYTGRTAAPTAAVANTCTHLRSAFDKFARHNTTREPITVVRGTHVPTRWAGSRADYLATAFPVGAKVQLAQVTSATTRTTTAGRFANHGGTGSYLMVIRTRDGLPVKAISANAGEDEVIVPPGTALRCVRVDDRGVEHQPTVYLVAEDLVAEAEATTVRAARAS